ncbi:MAG: hypothetical protein AAFX93_07510 [Verrucomicrobiota bacterium]
MNLDSPTSRGFRSKLEVDITADQFPEITKRCSGDPYFQNLIANNLARVVEEYLKAAEEQITEFDETPKDQ